jgi:hypothetical protein
MTTQISGTSGVSLCDTNSVPTGALQANSVGSTAIQNGSITFADFLASDWTASLGATGSQKLPSGLILKWGTVSATAGGAGVTFAQAFPTACYGVFTQGNGAGTYYQTQVSAVASTGFTATSLSGTLACFWFAIGR